MDVRMNVELVKKSLYQLGDKTQADIAERLDCDEGTVRRLLNGDPVREKTAAKVCERLKLNPLDVIIFKSNSNTLQIDLDEQANMYQHFDIKENEHVSEAAMVATSAASDAMTETLKHYDAESLPEVVTSLSLLILSYAVPLAQENPQAGFFFLDDIFNRVRSSIHLGLADEEIEDHTEVREDETEETTESD